MFKNREDAGKQLAEKLTSYKQEEAVILALPRGGVVLAYEIARAFKLPLDIVVVRKIGHPLSPEYAIGAVDENGTILLTESETVHIDQGWLKGEIARQKAEAKRRSLVYRGARKPPVLQGKTVILVDDGIATGLSMQLAIRAVKKQRPKKVIVAVPVAAAESLRVLKEEGADDVILLQPVEEFMGSVGAHYEEFEQVMDDQVIRLLHSAQN